MKPKAIYDTVTANLNTDGSPSIIAWRGEGGTIARVIPADALHLAAPDLLAALTDAADAMAAMLATLRLDPKDNETLQAARAAIAKAVE